MSDPQLDSIRESLSQQYVTAGQEIPTDGQTGYLRGHGTMVRGGALHATTCGFIERVNKLISVQPVNSRYTGSVGDVLVGRVVEVLDKKWKVDINGRQNAVLMLSSVNLPGGVQRRRTYEDSLQMRSFFAEGDLISTEVQNVLSDGAVSLHTRSLKYGKLTQGVFLRVPAVLIKRCAQHFHSLPCGVDCILGNNGYIWLTQTPSASAPGGDSGGGGSGAKHMVDDDDDDDGSGTKGKDKDTDSDDDAEGRQRLSRVRNSIVALSKMFLPIFNSSIMQVYNDSIALGLSSKALLDPDMAPAVTQNVS